MIGTMIAQLYRLQHDSHPSKVFGYFILGKVLAAIFQCAAVYVALLGCIRFYRQQSAMALGKVHAGGWELIAIGMLAFLVSSFPRSSVGCCWVKRALMLTKLR